jgi:DNA-directed RNA polymerase subunit RPC12/RpoP
MNAEVTDAIETYTCSNCGATTSFDPGTRTLRCPFCGSEIAVRSSGAALPTITSPQLVLPFKVTNDQSTEQIREWLGSSFFAPGDVKSRAALDRGQGTYVPFWRFDADAHSVWEGEVSQTHTRQVPQTFTNSSGKQETRMVSEQYQTWHPRSGTHAGQHRTFVCASTGLTQAEADRLMPFPETGMLTYSNDVLVGFSSEEPGVDEDGAWQAGEARIREAERDACAREVERLTRADITLSNRRTALCYLPVWLHTYRYESKDFRVLVNGYTGEIVGDRPISKAKVILVVGGIVAVLVLVLVAYLVFGG